MKNLVATPLHRRCTKGWKKQQTNTTHGRSRYYKEPIQSRRTIQRPAVRNTNNKASSIGILKKWKVSTHDLGDLKGLSYCIPGAMNGRKVGELNRTNLEYLVILQSFRITWSNWWDMFSNIARHSKSIRACFQINQSFRYPSSTTGGFIEHQIIVEYRSRAPRFSRCEKIGHWSALLVQWWQK